MSGRNKLLKEIEVPDGVEVTVEGRKVKVKGPKGEIEREFNNEGVEISLEDGKVIVRGLRDRRKIRANVGTVAAHIRNMIRGVQEEFVYKLRIVYAHFPMRVKQEGEWIVIENFMGEKDIRKARIMPGARVEIKGKDIYVYSPNIEAAGQTAANMEMATKVRSDLDERKFQDGIYIVEKPVRR